MGGGLTLHINRGLGTAVYPIRFNCPPEVTLIEAQIVPR
jgi:predicted MPP superfamily phosphohydrolase